MTSPASSLSPSSGAETRSWAQIARMLLDIARPRVVALVVFTGAPALMLGKEEWPTASVAFWVLLGTALAGGASSAFNAVIERETDAFMARTKSRPLPAAALVPSVVAGYGALLTVLSTVILWAMGGPLAALIGLATIAFYVLVYTVWLKPRTPQNIVIGGAAGGVAPLIASAAADGEITLGAWILFLIIFLWTPPHFWAIAIVRRREYEAAGFPMMPSAVGDQGTRLRSLIYTLLLVPLTLAPVWLGQLSAAYGVAALLLGAWFLWVVVRSMILQRKPADQHVFRVSVVYLGLLFLAMFADLLAA